MIGPQHGCSDIADLIAADLREGPLGLICKQFTVEFLDGIQPAPVQISGCSPELSGVEGATIVAWKVRGVHDRNGWGLDRTGRALAIDGVTIVYRFPDGSSQVRRFIDWRNVRAQLGDTGGRPIPGAVSPVP